MKIGIVGVGNYVCGRGGEEYGVVLPAVLQWARDRPSVVVYATGNSQHGVKQFEERAKALGFKLGVKPPKVVPFTDMVNANCAAVIVVVPDNSHAGFAKRLLSNGANVLVVKPMAGTLQDAMQMYHAQHTTQRYGMVEFHKRWDRQILYLREQFRNGVLGIPVHCHFEMNQSWQVPSNTFRSWAHTTNSFQYLGIHYVDVVYFVTGASPLRAMATNQHTTLSDTSDAIQATIEWQLRDSGHMFTSTINTNWIEPARTPTPSNQRGHMVGTRGRLDLEQSRRGLRLVTEQGAYEPSTDFCFHYTDHDGYWRYSGYGIESIGTFLSDVKRLRNNTTTLARLEATRPTFRQALVSMRVLDAVNTSLAKGGEWVPCSQP